MQRTQIYFEENMLEELKLKASLMGISLCAYIRIDFSEFAGMWKDSDVTLEKIRKEAWR